MYMIQQFRKLGFNFCIWCAKILSTIVMRKMALPSTELKVKYSTLQYLVYNL